MHTWVTGYTVGPDDQCLQDKGILLAIVQVWPSHTNFEGVVHNSGEQHGQGEPQQGLGKVWAVPSGQVVHQDKGTRHAYPHNLQQHGQSHSQLFNESSY